MFFKSTPHYMLLGYALLIIVQLAPDSIKL